MSTTMDTTAEAARLLVELAGPDATLRPDQAEAIGALVDQRQRVLLVQRTGWGKSAVYWIATALRRQQRGGPTLVVSPLLALMRDQVEAARRLGLSADTVNSTNQDEWDRITAALDEDAIDVLLISPERLNAPSFRPHLDELAPRLGLLVVDEAHCISDWGHDFRPDYRRVRDVLDELPPDTPVLACTATANARVTEDVAAQLGSGEPGGDAAGGETTHSTLTLRGALGRDSLQLAVVRLGSAERRLAWLDAFVRRHRPQHGRAGVVYALTVADAERTARFLQDRGLDAAAYTSRVDPDDRLAVESQLAANELDVVVATSALGMGYDKPDLAFVVHLGAPSSPVSYYQQVGRAGRAIETAEVVLLPTAKDEAIWQHFDLAGIPGQAETDAVLEALPRDGALSVTRLEPLVDVRRSRLDLLLKVLDVDGAVEKVRGGYRRTDTPWRYDHERYERLRMLRRDEHAAMRAFAGGELDECLMVFLARQLDDKNTQACGRCQQCTGWEPDVVVDDEVVRSARRFLRTRDVVVPERRQWPTGLDEVSGRIPPGRRPAEGRALAGGDDSGWGEEVSALLELSEAGRFDTEYQGLLEEVVDGLVKVLARWDWDGRPAAITTVPSTTHARLLGDIAERLGTLGRLPVVGALDKGPGPHQAQLSNSPHKARNALQRIQATDDARSFPDGAVLVLDVAVDSGWTMTVAAWRLTASAERAVLPLVLQAGP